MKATAIKQIMKIFLESTGLHWSVSGRIAYEITEEGLLHGLYLQWSSYSTAEIAGWFSLPLFVYNQDLILSFGERLADREVSYYYEFDERGLEKEAKRLSKDFAFRAIPALARQYYIADLDRLWLRGNTDRPYRLMTSVAARVLMNDTSGAREEAHRLKRFCHERPKDDLTPWSQRLVDAVLIEPQSARDLLQDQVSASCAFLKLDCRVTTWTDSSLLELAREQSVSG